MCRAIEIMKEDKRKAKAENRQLRAKNRQMKAELTAENRQIKAELKERDRLLKNRDCKIELLIKMLKESGRSEGEINSYLKSFALRN